MVLVLAADERGLSFYGDETLSGLLPLSVNLIQARAELVRFGLIAWRAPLYQVLSLDPPPPPRTPGIQPACAALERLKHRWQGTPGAAS
jgi:hypothetical protein